MDRDDVNCRGLSRHHIMNSVEQSLHRLYSEYIDLYQVWECEYGNVGMGMNLLYNPLHSNAPAFDKVLPITECTSLINVAWHCFYLVEGILL